MSDATAMKVVVFYSFKGGVGRTTAMINVAYCLAQRGRKVVIADWDLHAPGLSLMDCMLPESGSLPRQGVLDYLLGLRDGGDPRVGIRNILYPTRLSLEAQARPQPADDSAEKQPMMGELFCIPAGNLADGADGFIQAVKDSNLHDLGRLLKDFGDDDRLVLKVFCEELFQTEIPWQLPDSEGPPDYLLIDCRTGVTEIGDLLLGEAVDLNVIVYGQDAQNMEGLRIALDGRERQPWEMSANTLLIWALGSQGPEELKVRQRRRKRQLVDSLCRVDSLGVTEPFPKEYLVPYHPEVPLTDSPMVHRYWNSELSKIYRDLSDDVEVKCYFSDTLIAAQERGLEEAQGPPAQAGIQRLVHEVPREIRLEDALTQLELVRPFTPFLYNPLPWEVVCSRPLEELTQGWPDGFPEDQRRILVNLLAFSPSLNPGNKERFLAGVHQLELVQATNLIKLLTEERQRFLSLGIHYWAYLRWMWSAFMEWWLTIAIGDYRADLEDKWLRPLLAGDEVESLALSTEPLFPLLLAEALDEAVAKEGSRIAGWLKEQVEEPAVVTVRLREMAVARVGDADPRVQAYLYRSLGSSMRTLAHKAPLEERANLLKSAVAAHEKSLTKRPDEPVTLNNLGIALVHLGQESERELGADFYTRAITAYEQSLATRPDDPDTLNNLGSALGLLGQESEGESRAEFFSRAIAYYEKSLAKRPESPNTFHNLGFALELLGRESEGESRSDFYARAITAYEQSLATRPDDPETLRNLGNALSDLGRELEGESRLDFYARAITAYEKSLATRPDDPVTLHSLGLALFNLGRASEGESRAEFFARAITAYEKSLAKKPDDPVTLHNLGLALELLGRASEGESRAEFFARAITAYEKSLAKRPDDPATLNGLGNALDWRGQEANDSNKALWLRKAVEAKQAAVKGVPGAAERLNSLVYSLLQVSRVASTEGARERYLEEARSHSTAAMAINPGVARHNFACVLAVAGEHESCLEQLGMLLKQRPELRKDVAKDPDFEGLRHLPEFQQLVDESAQPD